MDVLVTCKNKDLIKNESTRVANSAVLSPIWPNFKIIQDLMAVLVTCGNEEHPIKNEGTRLFTTLYINFSDAQGEITPILVVVSGRNLNSSKLSCPGAQLEGNLGKILALGAKILPYIGLREKWESP